MTQASDAQVESELVARLSARSHADVCAERLATIRERKKWPRLASVQVLDGDLSSKRYVVEVSWKAVLQQAGYAKTASALTATFLLSKQQRLDKLGFGAVCAESQMFNHIPGQAHMCDKAKVLHTLRAAMERPVPRGASPFVLEDFMMPTIVFRSGVPASDYDASLFAALERQLLSLDSAVAPPQQKEVSWVRKQPNVENSKGVTPFTWADLAAKRSQLGARGFKTFLGSGILQRYMASPMLLKGRKTDLRCYVLVSTVRPFSAFLYTDFLARTSPGRYSSTATDVRAFTVGVHLGHSGGKGSGGYNTAPEHNQWTPETLAAELKAEGRLGHGVEPQAWLRDVFRPSIKNVTSRLLWASEGQFTKQGGYFSVFGLDVLVDSSLKCYFSEMNYSPDLSDGTSSAYKVKMQREMLSAAFALQEEVLESRIFPSSSSLPLVTRLMRAAKQQKRLSSSSTTVSGAAALRPSLGRHRPAGAFEPVAMSAPADPGRIHWYHEGARW